MRTLIVYQSKHGTTEKIAKGIQMSFGYDKCEIANLNAKNVINIDKFDRIIVGGSIHASTIQKGIKRFISKYRDTLLKKELGLFLCCMYKGDESIKQFNNAYPEDLRDSAKAKGIFGGELIFEKMNFLEKFIVKKTTKTNNSISDIDTNAVSIFINEMQK